MRINMLSDDELERIVECDDPIAFREDFQFTISEVPLRMLRVCAMEILEFRRAYGPLGCEWLEC